MTNPGLPSGIAAAGTSCHMQVMSEDRKPAQHITPEPLQKLPKAPEVRPKEIGGPKGPEPTRYGDWERDGRCTDF